GRDEVAVANEPPQREASRQVGLPTGVERVREAQIRLSVLPLTIDEDLNRPESHRPADVKPRGEVQHQTAAKGHEVDRQVVGRRLLPVHSELGLVDAATVDPAEERQALRQRSPKVAKQRGSEAVGLDLEAHACFREVGAAESESPPKESI